MIKDREPIKDKVVAVLKRGDGTTEIIQEKTEEQQLQELLSGLSQAQLKTLLRLVLSRLVDNKE